MALDEHRRDMWVRGGRDAPAPTLDGVDEEQTPASGNRPTLGGLSPVVEGHLAKWSDGLRHHPPCENWRHNEFHCYLNPFHQVERSVVREPVFNRCLETMPLEGILTL